MLCYWGAQVREGLGLVKPDKVQHVNDVVGCVCPKSAIQDISAGRSTVGFIRNAKVSVLRLRGELKGRADKLSMINFILGYFSFMNISNLTAS